MGPKTARPPPVTSPAGLRSTGRASGTWPWSTSPTGNLSVIAALTQKDGRVVLSYALREDYWDKGLAPEACRAVVRYGFEQLRLEEIRTGTWAENRAWRAMMQKLGMTLREVGCNEDGGEVRYAASREEFFTLTSKD
jgi:RimJ/RimL family protein N-acetyltransferase